LPVDRFTKVLDAGCGRGQYSRKMAQTFPWIEVIAMDIKMRDLQGDHSPNLFFKQGNLLKLEDKYTYDFIYCIDVLEHIPNNVKVMQNFYEALKYGGYLYLHMPCDIGKECIFPDQFLAEFNRLASKEHIGEQYPLNEIKSILQKIGFKIIEVEYTFGFPGELAWELDRITDRKIALKVLLMPLTKLLGQIAVMSKLKRGNVLVLAKK